MSEHGGRSAGALLRAAREKQGLHIAALAAAIKVAPRKLDALENDRWDELPDATFTRALAQTVCRTLKVDAKPILELLPAAGAAALDPIDNHLNAPFRDKPGRVDPGASVAAIRPMIWAAALLMAAAVAVYFMPTEWLNRTAAPTADVVSAAVPTPVTPASAPGTTAAPMMAAEAASAAPAPASAVAVTAAVTPFAVPAASAPAPVLQAAVDNVRKVAPAAAAAPVASGATTGIVQLRTSGASWVEARDGRGQVLLSRIVLAGESLGLDGRLPIRLTIGNASVTQLGFRGQAVDLSGRTRDNVARVELQ